MSDRPGPLSESPAPAGEAPDPALTPAVPADIPPAPTADAPVPAPSAGHPVEVSDEPFTLTGPADEDAEETTPRSRTKTIVLGSLLAVTLAGMAVIGYAGWRIASQKDATLTSPPTVGNLKLDTTEEGRSTADYLQTALSAEVDLDHTTGGVYLDGTSTDGVLFFGGTTLIWTPGADLDTAFEIISDGQGAVTGLHDVDAGKLGGTMKCGTTKTDNADMPVCGWADHGSLALAMFPGRTGKDAATLILQIRNATQTRK
ncbi:hypothetical protein [Winogradskya humida]|uniref:Uncharacterized protein n=1 Tax=Winogradskya humida TaxID=113566 RepID=A0ABQ4A0S9_9ACTN|nr:hypothetical protein [Actinoplanes humidus]GIE24446.1 hypothetical protein Ahu01nite_075480 [Actinoplanes humidus]